MQQIKDWYLTAREILYNGRELMANIPLLAMYKINENEIQIDHICGSFVVRPSRLQEGNIEVTDVQPPGSYIHKNDVIKDAIVYSWINGY